MNDPFAGTDLAARLKEIAPERIFITGWATDLCVDATVRSAVSNHYDVVVVTDGHTLNDRPHLDAASVIRHHNWVWSNLITQRSVRLARTDELAALTRLGLTPQANRGLASNSSSRTMPLEHAQ